MQTLKISIKTGYDCEFNVLRSLGLMVLFKNIFQIIIDYNRFFNFSE